VRPADFTRKIILFHGESPAKFVSWNPFKVRAAEPKVKPKSPAAISDSRAFRMNPKFDSTTAAKEPENSQGPEERSGIWFGDGHDSSVLKQHIIKFKGTS